MRRPSHGRSELRARNGLALLRVPGTEPRYAGSNRKDKDDMLPKIIGIALLAWAMAARRSMRPRPCTVPTALKETSPTSTSSMRRTGALICTIGPIGFSVTGLAVHPTTGVLFGSTGNASPIYPGSLITINKTTGAGTLVGSFGIQGKTMTDLTFTSDGDALWVAHRVRRGVATISTPSTRPREPRPRSAHRACPAHSEAGWRRTPPTRSSRRPGDDGPLRTVNRTTGEVATVATLDGTSGDASPR